jgi:hypothetical protein
VTTVRQVVAVPFYLVAAALLKVALLIDGPDGRRDFGLKLKKAL